MVDILMLNKITLKKNNKTFGQLGRNPFKMKEIVET